MQLAVYIIKITRNGKLVSRDFLHTRRLPRVPRDERFGHLVTAFENEQVQHKSSDLNNLNFFQSAFSYYNTCFRKTSPIFNPAFVPYG